VTFGAPVARRGRQFLSATHGIDWGSFFLFPPDAGRICKYALVQVFISCALKRIFSAKETHKKRALARFAGRKGFFTKSPRQTVDAAATL